jgi:hypothetical protein
VLVFRIVHLTPFFLMDKLACSGYSLILSHHGHHTGVPGTGTRMPRWKTSVLFCIGRGLPLLLVSQPQCFHYLCRILENISSRAQEKVIWEKLEEDSLTYPSP